MSAGDYRKPAGKPSEANMALWFNWSLYEMAVRLGYVTRKGVSTTTADNVDMSHPNGMNEGKSDGSDFDMEELMDEFFDKWDEMSSDGCS